MPTKDLEVRASSIHGLGVFALRDFCSGEIMIRWNCSQIIRNEEVASLSSHDRQYTHPFDRHRALIVQAPERYVNHSCNNNTEVRDFCDIAVREIHAGEEITSNYSTDGSDSSFDCRCNHDDCRGRIE